MGFLNGESWVSADIPEDAGVIQEVRGGILGFGYSVSLENRLVGTFDDQEEAEKMLLIAMDLAKYWPDCYHINERGNVTQIIPE